MNTIQIILGAIQMIVCIGLIVLVILQKSTDGGGASAALGGSASSESFFGKNKSNTAEAKMSKWTIIAGVSFVALTLVLNILELIK